MRSQYRPTQSSNLTSGARPPSYGVFPSSNDPLFDRQNNNPPPYAPRSAAPGATPTRPPGPIPHPTGGPSRRRTSIVISPGLRLVIYLAIIFLQLLIVFRPDTPELKQARDELNLERAKLRLERRRLERETLEWEREREKLGWARVDLKLERERLELERRNSQLERQELGWERERWKVERGEWELERDESEAEREKLRRERELWEKAREDRVPQGAFWQAIQPALDCRAYGKREYRGVLQNIPEGWSPIDACMNMPAEIKGVTVRRPSRCLIIEGSVHGYWMVDWDQPDCKPWHRDFHDAGCTSYRSGKRRIEAHLVGINKSKEQDWLLLCSSTPLVWDQVTYTSPTHCERRRRGRKVAMWDVPDDSCL